MHNYPSCTNIILRQKSVSLSEIILFLMMVSDRKALLKTKELLKLLFQFNQTIFVSREGADSRSRAVNMIKERVRNLCLTDWMYYICNNDQRNFHQVLSPLPWPQFVLWPEGTCSNRFSTGRQFSTPSIFK